LAEREACYGDQIFSEIGHIAPSDSLQEQFRVRSTDNDVLLQGEKATLICFSHLRWHFVYQRPQHLMTRFARMMRVFFVEEPVFGETSAPVLELHPQASGVTVVVPRLPHGLDEAGRIAAQRRLVDGLCRDQGISRPVLWYYTPMSGPFSEHLDARAVVYDCMDELSAFKGAPPTLLENERRLFGRARVVFTGGISLYEAKRRQHPSVHAFPSSVEVGHFRRAREPLADPPDQASIPRPRIGHYAVLDERLDTGLLAGIADARPDWQLILVGPVVKIDPAELPRRPNIHYLGGKSYAELPAYLAGWDAAFMPFALNESTRFISPTKTPEYLAAGRPVVSTPITDVVRSYGERGLVRIASAPAEFVAALEATLDGGWDRRAWLAEVDELLAQMSWDITWNRMKELLA
jgi:glycosyltransferase involved in cell wall biosynthesis